MGVFPFDFFKYYICSLNGPPLYTQEIQALTNTALAVLVE